MNISQKEVFVKEKQCGNWHKAIVPCIEKINKALGEKVLMSDKEKVVFKTDSSEFKGKPISRKVKEVFGYTKFDSSNSTLLTITFRKSTEVLKLPPPKGVGFSHFIVNLANEMLNYI